MAMDSKAAEYIRGADLIIFDEATMADRFVFETIDKLLREIMDYEAPFGGKVMLIGTLIFSPAPLIFSSQEATGSSSSQS